MNINRPHIVAKKSFFYLFRRERRKFVEKKFIRNFRNLLLCTIFAVVLALLKNTIIDSVHVNDTIDPFIPYVVYGLVAINALVVLFALPYVIWRIACIKAYRIEFYESYVIIKSGIFWKKETKSILPKIQKCRVYRSFMGRIFNYGYLFVDTVGKWDIKYDDTAGIKNPLYLRRYLENHFLSSKDVKSIRQTVFTSDAQSID